MTHRFWRLRSAGFRQLSARQGEASFAPTPDPPYLAAYGFAYNREAISDAVPFTWTMRNEN